LRQIELSAARWTYTRVTLSLNPTESPAMTRRSRHRDAAYLAARYAYRVRCRDARMDAMVLRLQIMTKLAIYDAEQEQRARDRAQAAAESAAALAKLSAPSGGYCPRDFQ